MRTTLSAALMGALGLALGACSDEPSEAAMRQAATEFLALKSGQEAAEIVARTGATRTPLSITSFRKVGCVAAQPLSGHDCRFEVGVNGIDKGEQRGRFLKAPDGSLILSE